MELTWGLPEGLSEACSHLEELIGPRGVIRTSLFSDEVLLITREGSKTVSGLRCDLHLEKIRGFAQAVRQGTVPPATGEDGRRALEVSLAILESMETGELISLG